MTVQGEDQAAAATQSSAAETASSETKPSGPGRPVRFLRTFWRAFIGFPRVTIEAVLMVASLLVGLFILPSLTTPSASGPPAIQGIVLDRPSNIKSYVLFDDYAKGNDFLPREDTLVLGMDVPNGKTAPFQLLIIYNAQDKLVHVSPSAGVTFAGKLSASDLGESGFRGVLYSGTMTGGSNSYTEFENGYFQRFSENFSFNSGASGLPKDDAGIDFQVSGPVQVASVSGANVSMQFPYITHKDESAGKSATTEPVNTEVFFDGGNYQAVTGGATIQGGHYWDWFTNTGFFPPTSATGLDAVEQANEQNKTFIAAAMFGLSAAAVAALSIELVEAVAVTRERRRHRHAPPESSYP